MLADTTTQSAQHEAMKSLAQRSAPASLRATGPTAPGGCGKTCWRKACRARLHRIERLMRCSPQCTSARAPGRADLVRAGQVRPPVAPTCSDRTFDASAPTAMDC